MHEFYLACFESFDLKRNALRINELIGEFLSVSIALKRGHGGKNIRIQLVLVEYGRRYGLFHGHFHLDENFVIPAPTETTRTLKQ